MTYKKENTASRKSPSRWQLSEARSGQYKGDYRFYKLFAQIWGWDGVKAKPEKAVNKLCKYIRREERKHPVKRQRPRDPELQFAVGVAYLSGWIPDEKYQNKAAMWFARSYEQGCDKGALGTGYIYERGMAESDPVTDYEHMVKAYTDAAKQKNVYAQYRLAKILYDVDPDNPRLTQLLFNAVDADYTPAKELMEKVNRHPRKTAVPDEQKNLTSKQYDKLYELLVEIWKSQHRIEAAVMMLQTSLNGMWKELREAEADHAEQLAELQTMVQQNLMKTTSSEIKDAETFMSILFGGDWRNPARLCDESCDALVSAHVLMAAADRLGIKNYAGIVITAIWALEHECRRRFRDAFDRYLADIHVKEADRPIRMNLDPANNGSAKFTLGSVDYVVANPKKKSRSGGALNASEFDAFANATGLLSDAAKQAKKSRKYTNAGMVFWDYYLPGSKKSLTRIINELNNDYRIPAAHAGEMSKAKAEVCCSLLGITEENKRKAEQAHKDLDNVEGALKALLWLTAPLK